jgi:UDP-N-acetylglucosamine 2-epimerase (non-hydrolysing)
MAVASIARMAAPVCFVVGARPNFMKAAPVVEALRSLGVDVLLVHTGQHYDAEMSDVFLGELALPVPDVFLGVGSGSHAEQTSRALIGIEEVLIEHVPKLVVVPGDVNSTLAGALAAAKLGIPVAHLEAGLRSFDPSMPEEHNRRLTDHLSSLLLTHSPNAVENLAREGITSGVHLVGNTMIDSLLSHLTAARAAAPWLQHGLTEAGYGLVTLHRPALVDDPVLLRDTVQRLLALAEAMPLVFPVHPRTAERLSSLNIDRRIAVSELIITRPLGYLEFLGLESAAQFVLTDSGGIQEETSALGVPCFTLRNTTERPITIELGTNVLLGLEPERIALIPELLDARPPVQPIPWWDGQAGKRAAEVIERQLVGSPLSVGA